MPTWLILAMATSLFYSIINIIDKGILDRLLKRGGAEVLLVFSCVFALFGIPYAIYMEPGVLDISLINAAIMLTVALLNTVLLYCYLKAMEGDDPTTVIFFYQLVPVFTAVIGYFVLGETITKVEGVAMALIIVGTSIAGVERSELKEFRIKWRTVILMLIATICWATEMVIGKVVILDESVYHSIFWESVFMVIVGVSIVVFSRKSRRRFAIAMKINKKWIIGLMLLGEVLYAAGNSISAHASEIKEVAMVMLTQPLQTIFVFVIGLFLALLRPDLFGKINHFRVIQMAIAIMIAFGGTYLLL
jgi:drug/metabolite transporter (DMT)-like permease